MRSIDMQAKKQKSEQRMKKEAGANARFLCCITCCILRHYWYFFGKSQLHMPACRLKFQKESAINSFSVLR